MKWEGCAVDSLVLLGLALLDSLSAGTLVVPIVLLIRWRRLRAAQYSTYLATIAVAYFALGVLLLLGFRWVVNLVTQAAASTWFAWVTLILGVVLAAFGILSPNPKKRTAEEIVEQRAAQSGGGYRLLAMIMLALAAAVTEVATMLPYLAAIGILQSLSLAFVAQLGVLAVYCVVMVSPAILIGAVAGLFGDRVFTTLIKVIPRLEYEVKITLLWLAAIAGIYLLSRSVGKLGLI